MYEIVPLSTKKNQCVTDKETYEEFFKLTEVNGGKTLSAYLYASRKHEQNFFIKSEYSIRQL